MQFERTYDAELIRAIATHPKVWPTLADDLVSDPAHWKPVLHEGIWYVLAGQQGMFIFFPENSVSWQIHVCLLPEFWGGGARAMKQVFTWLWAQTPCRRITGSVPTWNQSAFLCAVNAGMEPFGVNKNSSLKDGKLHHQVLFGISKPEKAA